ncbi:hypothetical protein HY488_00670 [Candidatus Woesearchaeota archaeon]|nr:hypothetical protein [Candidatus Woesearchaeota archaeon]
MTMRQKKGISIPVVFVLLIFLSSCTGLYRGRQQATPYTFHTGTQGMVLEFFPGSPPDRLYEGDSLTLLVKYANKGAYTVEGGMLYVSGYDRAYVPLVPDQMPFNAEGKSIYNPEGLISYTAEFSAGTVIAPPYVDVFPQTFKVTACYKYRTEAAVDVCIDPDPLRIQPQDKVCVIHDASLSSQGAPVAVTRVEEDAAKGRVQFKIAINNVGGGTVIASSAGSVPLDRCQADLRQDEVDKVEISAELSGRFLECNPKQVRLINGQGIAFCSLFLTDYQTQDAYQTTLNVYLDYGYRNSIAKRVDVLKLPGTPRFY